MEETTMKVRGPVLTLLAVVGLALVLLVVNTRQDPARAPDQAAQTDAAPPPAAPTAATAQAFPAEAVYTGRAAGDRMTVAIAIRGGKAAAYLCDGNRVEAWLEGPVQGEELRLEGKGGATVTVRPDGDAVSGQISVQGRQLPYTAQPAAPPAGLYEGEATVDGAPARIGWIVLPDGSQVGVGKVGGDPGPAPVLDLGRGGAAVDGVFVAARPIRGDDDVTG
ncbi:hypothetical protein PA7_06160 [Pseudonocardia asaccharolytica DSM 44247 = NBRC 16224]|uniref:Uncharacterized protein n=2 Tax=Pseudonocardia asaccharolytica TaxID=54010 RepID=A0A511CW30_9PSEU|nr:hypothetical protein PA7_06160 [Pseudonocardia asaccharolytica DSM 44247 = NBRC 16224]